MPNESDPKKPDMEQYREVIRNLTDRFGDLDPHNPVNATMWIMHCIQECYQDGERKPDPSRAADVVTSLSWLIMKLLETIGEPQPTVRQFADRLLENDLDKIEWFDAKATFELDHAELEVVKEFEVDFSDMGSLMNAVEWILIEIDLMRDLSALDEPGFLDSLGGDDLRPE